MGNKRKKSRGLPERGPDGRFLPRERTTTQVEATAPSRVETAAPDSQFSADPPLSTSPKISPDRPLPTSHRSNPPISPTSHLHITTRFESLEPIDLSGLSLESPPRLRRNYSGHPTFDTVRPRTTLEITTPSRRTPLFPEPSSTIIPEDSSYLHLLPENPRAQPPSAILPPEDPSSLFPVNPYHLDSPPIAEQWREPLPAIPSHSTRLSIPSVEGDQEDEHLRSTSPARKEPQLREIPVQMNSNIDQGRENPTGRPGGQQMLSPPMNPAYTRQQYLEDAAVINILVEEIEQGRNPQLANVVNPEVQGLVRATLRGVSQSTRSLIEARCLRTALRTASDAAALTEIIQRFSQQDPVDVPSPARPTSGRLVEEPRLDQARNDYSRCDDSRPRPRTDGNFDPRRRVTEREPPIDDLHSDHARHRQDYCRDRPRDNYHDCPRDDYHDRSRRREPRSRYHDDADSEENFGREVDSPSRDYRRRYNQQRVEQRNDFNSRGRDDGFPNDRFDRPVDSPTRDTRREHGHREHNYHGSSGRRDYSRDDRDEERRTDSHGGKPKSRSIKVEILALDTSKTPISAYISQIDWLVKTYGKEEVLRAIVPGILTKPESDGCRWFQSLTPDQKQLLGTSISEWKRSLRRRFQRDRGAIMQEADDLKHSFSDESQVDLKSYIDRKLTLYNEAGEMDEDAKARRLVMGVDPILANLITLDADTTVDDICNQLSSREYTARRSYIASVEEIRRTAATMNNWKSRDNRQNGYQNQNSYQNNWNQQGNPNAPNYRKNSNNNDSWNNSPKDWKSNGDCKTYDNQKSYGNKQYDNQKPYGNRQVFNQRDSNSNSQSGKSVTLSPDQYKELFGKSSSKPVKAFVVTGPSNEMTVYEDNEDIDLIDIDNDIDPAGSSTEDGTSSNDQGDQWPGPGRP